MKKTTIIKEYNEDGKLTKETTVIEESYFDDSTFPTPTLPKHPFEPTYVPPYIPSTPISPWIPVTPWTPYEPTITKTWEPCRAKITWTDDNTADKRGLYRVKTE